MCWGAGRRDGWGVLVGGLLAGALLAQERVGL